MTKFIHWTIALLHWMRRMVTMKITIIKLNTKNGRDAGYCNECLPYQLSKEEKRTKLNESSIQLSKGAVDLTPWVFVMGDAKHRRVQRAVELSLVTCHLSSIDKRQGISFSSLTGENCENDLLGYWPANKLVNIVSIWSFFIKGPWAQMSSRPVSLCAAQLRKLNPKADSK